MRILTPMVKNGVVSAAGEGESRVFSLFPFMPGFVEIYTHALRNGLQRSGLRNIFKMHGEKGLKQVLKRSDGVLGFFKTKSYYEQKKVDQKSATGYAEQLFGKSAA